MKHTKIISKRQASKDSEGPYWIANTFDASTRDGRIVIHPGTLAESTLE